MAALLTFTLIVVSCLVLQLATAKYDSDFCYSKTSWATSQKYAFQPFFFDDFSMIVESSFYKVENVSDAMVSHRQFSYSNTVKQAVVYEEKPNNTFWAFLDQKSQDCFFKKDAQECIVEKGDCTETAKEVGLGSKEGDTISLGSSSGAMSYPSVIKKTVKFDNQNSRNIAAYKIGICSYRADTDETLVTYLLVLRPQAYSNMDQTQKKVLAALVHSKKPGGKVTFERHDYTAYTKLNPSLLINGFQMGEGKCGTLKSDFTSRTPPRPSVRFSYSSQQLATGPGQTRAVYLLNEQHEYNQNSQISQIVTEKAVAGQIEKNRILEVEDFRGHIFYQYSLTNGDCNVSTLSSHISRDRQLSPQQFWGMIGRDPTYKGVYWNRDIQCDLWLYEGTDQYTKTVSLYTANNDWLVANGYSKGTFLPIQVIMRGDINVFNEIYTFKDNPGYHIPYLPACFQYDDTVNAEVTLMINFNRIIANRFIHFEYEFRTMLMKITGIKSLIRISRITPLPSPSNPETETIVVFSINGKLEGYDDRSNNIYKPDPVTSHLAVYKINKQVDKGSIDFTLDEEKITIAIKKNSFAVSDADSIFYRYLDHSDQIDGYSSEAMAGAALGILIACLLLSVAAAYGYKRYTGAGASGGSMGMSNINFTNSSSA